MGDNAPFWLQCISAIFLFFAYTCEILFCWPKIKCPKCKWWTSKNDEKFCKICLDNY